MKILRLFSLPTLQKPKRVALGDGYVKVFVFDSQSEMIAALEKNNPRIRHDYLGARQNYKACCVKNPNIYRKCWADLYFHKENTLDTIVHEFVHAASWYVERNGGEVQLIDSRTGKRVRMPRKKEREELLALSVQELFRNYTTQLSQ